ncbi:MAG: type IV pilin protein, partial [Pseudomonadota bacterium]|nr:type IV pilin protein [Pseudomonadota bacterium]
VAIAAILAAIAYPSYLQQVQKTRRGEAKTTLLDTAQVLERCYSTYSAYDDANCAVATDLADGMDSESQLYNLTAPTLTADRFTLRATPLGAQADDADCTRFELESTGKETAEGADAENCW